MHYQGVIDYWFTELSPKQWWVKDEAFDEQLRTRFAELNAQAARSELFEWRQSPEGRLAEIIVLDQFSRNMYRDTPAAFATDPLSLCLAQHAVALGVDQQLSAVQRAFLYMPYMHSESVRIHEVAVGLYQDAPKDNLDFELRHKAIIDRFGRYPHRNAILGRTSTEEELTFLSEPGSSF